MKKKRTSARKHPEGLIFIQCTACGNDEFERSLSERGAIVRLAHNQNRDGVQEKVIREGVVEFTYGCTKCKSVLIDAAKTAQKNGTRAN